MTSEPQEPVSGTETLCIIPARGGSKRFPRKNVAPLRGKPLLAYSIEAARDAGVFGLVCVSSEDREILEVARTHGADLALLRSERLASDEARVKDVCLQVLEEVDSGGRRFDIFAVLLPTTPLRSPDDLREAHDLFRASDAQCLMSVVAFSHPPQRAVWMPEGFVEPYFGGKYMKRAQDLETLYRHDGSILLARRAPFEESGDFYGDQVLPYPVDPERSVDVDHPIDLRWAEFLLSGEDQSGDS